MNENLILRELLRVYFMLCDICQARQASINVVISQGSEISHLRLCQECASGNGSKTSRIAQSKSELVCPSCYTKWNIARNKNLLGCPRCYDEFFDELKPFLLRIHGNTEHTGKQYHRKRKIEDATTEEGFFNPFNDYPLSLAPEAEFIKGAGPEGDVAISSRIRLARNINGHRFCHSADLNELSQIAVKVEKAIRNIGSCNYLNDLCIINLDSIDQIDRQFLVERHIISRDLSEKTVLRKVIISGSEIVSIMINEEDHVRLQVIGSGLQIKELWNIVNQIDERLAEKVDYAFSPRLGYLTACPTNVGTGLRVSVMLYIPALTMSDRGKWLLTTISKLGYNVRGFYGEGTDIDSSFFQISNGTTLGQSEENIAGNIYSIAQQIIDHERRERERLLRENKMHLEDVIFRAYGILTNARTLSFKEGLYYLSLIGMGVSIGMIRDIALSDVIKLVYLMQPAHLRKLEGIGFSAEENEDLTRAEVIRRLLIDKLIVN